MLYIALNSEAKTHILSNLYPSPTGREVITVCGLVHPETDFVYSTEDDSNLCSRCSGKVDIEEVPVEEPVDTTTPTVVDSGTDSKKSDEEPRSTPKK